MRRFALVALAVTATACQLPAIKVSVSPPAPVTDPAPAPAPAPAQTWAVDIVACAETVTPCAPIEGASIGLHVRPGSGDDAYDWQTSNADGYALFRVPSSLVDSDTLIEADGYEKTGAHVDVAAWHDGQHHGLVAVPSLHFDPSTVPLAELAAFRGAMWPNASRCPGGLTLPDGPRPGQPDNIIATDFFAGYSSEDQQAILTCLARLGYTHVVMGPVIDSDGYHGQYTPRDWSGANFDKFLDVAQTFWDGVVLGGERYRFIPVVFLHPDAFDLQQFTNVIGPLLDTPRAKKLLRVVIPTGWEPTKYGWSSETWAAYVALTRAKLPNALIGIHTVSDVDAPVGTDALGDDNGKPNGEGWQRVVSAGLDFWCIQNGAYAVAPSQDANLARNFAAQFMPDGDGATLHGARWHFAHAIASWPSTTNRGLPLALEACEITAFNGYWQNMPEDARDAWGDLAVCSGSDGYLDGGSAPTTLTAEDRARFCR